MLRFFFFLVATNNKSFERLLAYIRVLLSEKRAEMRMEISKHFFREREKRQDEWDTGSETGSRVSRMPDKKFDRRRELAARYIETREREREKMDAYIIR